MRAHNSSSHSCGRNLIWATSKHGPQQSPPLDDRSPFASRSLLCTCNACDARSEKMGETQQLSLFACRRLPHQRDDDDTLESNYEVRGNLH